MSLKNRYEIIVDVCPSFKKEVRYCPNPYYKFVCIYCKYDGSRSDLLKGILVEEAEELIEKRQREINKIKEDLKEKINISYRVKNTRYNKFEIMDI